MKTYARSLILGTSLCSIAAYANSVYENAPSLEAISSGDTYTILVTSLQDEVSNNQRTISLRNAINFANQHPDKNIIIKMRPGTYYLTITGSNEDRNATGDLDIADRTGKLTILSLSDNPLVTIDATGLGDRVLEIFGGDVTLIGLKLIGGSQVYNGGAIVNRGNLTIKDTIISGNSAIIGGGINNDIEAAKLVVYTSTISKNSADTGGGIYNLGTVEANSSSISGNKAVGGGGLYQTGHSSSTISHSKIENNSAGFGGGGIESENNLLNLPVLKVFSSSINNNAAGVLGGGIESAGFGKILVKDSIISGNSTGDRGGGGLFIGDTAEIINTTISNNFIVQPPTGIQYYGGGGIHLGEQGNLTLKDSTIFNNSSVSAGGGIFTYGGIIKIIHNNISFNQARNDDGGGIYVNPLFGPGILDIANSQITNNATANNGGGIYNSGTLTVTDSNIAKNIADSDHNGTGHGGGIFNNGSLTLLGRNTIVNNQPDNIFK